MSDALRDAALDYHRQSPPGKLGIHATKPLTTQRDLALAYSPGVAAACEAIVADPGEAATLTARANLVAVISNGTAVLGLGAIGPLAAKPVMEGKAVLFKKFAGIDVFDIEIDERDPDKLVDIVASLEPTFGGINLEDIKAPECFEIEEKLRARMRIPVFHDDQHGTSIIVAAAILNGLRVVGKDIGQVKLVCSGAGAAALACLDLLVNLGLKVERTFVADVHGVVWKGRPQDMDPRKARYAKETNARALADVIGDADIFLGLSAARVLKPELLKKMAARPLILALANPVPEIMPDEAKAARPDAIVATGRSDYPNQVNNVLCFPYIFRGALDCGATAINEAMKLACVRAIADLATAELSDVVAQAYGGELPTFGPDYLIPKPFDPRLIVEIPLAVARAAQESGVATRPIADMDAYRQRLVQHVFRTGFAMKPLFERARANPLRVAYAEGEEERVLRAAQTVVDEGLAKPVLIGRRSVILDRVKRLNLRLKLDQDVGVVDPTDDPRYNDYWRNYHALTERRGVTPSMARERIRTRTSVIGAMMLVRGDADALICGTVGRYRAHLAEILPVLGLKPGVRAPAALGTLLLPRGMFFICDSQVTFDPDAETIAENALLGAEAVKRFGMTPKVAMLSHSSFGTGETPSAQKMREALSTLRAMAPELEVEGEMHGDAAISETIREMVFPNSRLKGTANLLIMPGLDAAHIAFNLLKVLGDGISIGPLLLGVARPAHILTPSQTVRGIVNMTAVAVAHAQDERAAASVA
ncbi:MAG: NADP-dependent malic enzyme [Alphaproteobacteria bacterium]|nr:NADP-dependent malic enzyme [Alphaproteobacteria bacterium]